MNQRTRMFTVLGALAVSMMGATALLGWIEPEGPGLPDAAQLMSIQESARRIIAEDRPPFAHVSDTRMIEIAECSDEPAQSSGGDPGLDECDYVVTRDGELRVGQRRWEAVDSNDCGSLRIGLVSDWSRAPVTSVQWHALRSLLDELAGGDVVETRNIRLASSRSSRNASGSAIQLAAWLGDNGWLSTLGTAREY